MYMFVMIYPQICSVFASRGVVLHFMDKQYGNCKSLHEQVTGTLSITVGVSNGAIVQHSMGRNRGVVNQVMGRNRAVVNQFMETITSSETQALSHYRCRTIVVNNSEPTTALLRQGRIRRLYITSS